MTDKTAAERAAEERYPDQVPHNPLAFEPRERAAFIAGWKAHPVFTRERLRVALYRIAAQHRMKINEYERQQIADALLAQGDVPDLGGSGGTYKPDEAAIRADEREKCAQIAEKEGHSWSGSPAHAMFKIAAAIREDTRVEVAAAVDGWMRELAAADRVTVASDIDVLAQALHDVLESGYRGVKISPGSAWHDRARRLIASGVLGVPADEPVNTSSAQVDAYGNYYCPACKSWLPLEGNWGAVALQEHIGELHE